MAAVVLDRWRSEKPRHHHHHSKLLSIPKAKGISKNVIWNRETEAVERHHKDASIGVQRGKPHPIPTTTTTTGHFEH
jgi:hypothetical protein